MCSWAQLYVQILSVTRAIENTVHADMISMMYRYPADTISNLCNGKQNYVQILSGYLHIHTVIREYTDQYISTSLPAYAYTATLLNARSCTYIRANTYMEKMWRQHVPFFGPPNFLDSPSRSNWSKPDERSCSWLLVRTYYEAYHHILLPPFAVFVISCRVWQRLVSKSDQRHLNFEHRTPQYDPNFFKWWISPDISTVNTMGASVGVLHNKKMKHHHKK